MSCYIIAEIGINHNGDIEQAIDLIAAAHAAGCDAVKFQKRTVDVVYSIDELLAPRISPLGMTNGDLKWGLEFGEAEYKRIDQVCKSIGMDWFASCWDVEALYFIDNFDPPCYKIASALLTDDMLLKITRLREKPIEAPPFPGRSLVPAFAKPNLRHSTTPPLQSPRTIFFHHQGNRALRVGDWKIDSANIDGDKWCLYDLSADRAESTDLACEHPERVREMSAQWQNFQEEFIRQANAGNSAASTGERPRP